MLPTLHRRLLLSIACSLAILTTIGCASPAKPAQPPAASTAPDIASTAPETSCCGPITPAGLQLRDYLDSLHVDNLWQAHEHINWKTGEHIAGSGHEPPTHCSAFAAAAAMRLDIYLLRPPDHSQNMLSLAQERWLSSSDGRADGWSPVMSPKDAQTLANQGYFVVLVYGREHGSGHIAIVRPAEKTDAALAKDGPQTTQAGGHNFTSGTAKYSFVFHPGAWPNQVKIFAHPTKFQTTTAPQGQ